MTRLNVLNYKRFRMKKNVILVTLAISTLLILGGCDKKPKDGNYENLSSADLKDLCDDKDGKACTQYGMLLMNGTKEPLSEDQLKDMLKSFDLGCVYGNGLGCAAIAEIYDDGFDSIKSDKTKATSYYLKACEADYSDACITVSWYYTTGEGVAVDKEKALDFAKKACSLGNNKGCNNVGTFYSQGEGGLEPDQVKAKEYFKKACDSGIDGAVGCSNLGDYFYEEEKFDLAKNSYEMGCNGKVESSCTRLGEIYENGHGVKIDLKKAKDLYEQSCYDEEKLLESKNGISCAFLGAMYENGKGVASNLAKAKELYGKACDDGYQQACSRYNAM